MAYNTNDQQILQAQNLAGMGDPTLIAALMGSYNQGGDYSTGLTAPQYQTLQQPIAPIAPMAPTWFQLPVRDKLQCLWIQRV
jgi:hypothetical protein